MKIKSGVIMPNPEDPTKCIVSSCDKLKLKYMPNFVLKSMLKKEVVGRFSTSIANFKKSAAYKELGLDQQ